MQHSSELVVVLDGHGTMTYVSQSVLPLLGYTPEAVEGRNAFEVLHPDEVRTLARTFYLAQAEPGVGVPFEVRIEAADGRWTIFELLASNMLDDPDVRGIVLHGRDVTERYESQRRFRTLFEASPVPQALVYADRSGQLVNRAFCSLFGHAAADLTKRSLLELVHVDDHDAVHAEYDELVAGRAEHVTGDRRYIKADGELFFGRSNVSVVRDLNGAMEFFLITIDDVTTQLEQTKKIVTSEARWRSLVEHSPDIVCILYPNGRWNANEAAVQLLGYPKGYDRAKSIFELVHPDDIEAAATALEEVRAGTRRANQPLELRFRDVHGKYWDLECVGQNLGDDPDVGGVIVTARNITERKAMERALHAARQQFQAIFEHAPLCISLVDLEGTIVDINFAACELLGRTRQELIGTSAAETVHPDDIEQLIETTTRQLSGSDLAAEFRLLRADGTPVWVLSSAAIVDPGGDAEPYVVTIQTDITERRLLEERLAHEATRDPLTGLLNRGAFMTQLELALARTGVPTALLFLDLDGFKHVNDTLGHEAGDAVLATLARRIQDVVRDDDIVARFGGDEFVVLCRDANEREALAVAERVRATTDRPVVVRGAAASVGASVGVALSNSEDVSARLLRRADTAAYSAKRAGRGRVVLAAAAA